MKKNVFVLRVNDYRPDLCRYTLPTIRAYASKIGAEYREITSRVFDGWPVTYEKLQVHELGEGADWNVLVDADFILHPDLPDFTATLPRDTVGFHYGFDASKLFEPDVYFLRHGRAVGIAGGFVITSDWTHDLWTPLTMPVEVARLMTRREFILDEYTISRNLARYGLKYAGVETSPMIGQLMVHLGNEEKTEDERLNDVFKARNLFTAWGFTE